ncbi:MAG TPA: type II toxin-antitoxin system PemK/MazF family toxin [Beijerinckiaceae bacterium]|nr:type II toxin-antitoxin system PemK/MazF family toxin [Beijerinckiaceae bacterium]
MAPRANRTCNRLQVVPLTSKLKCVYTWEARVKGQSRKALADQILTVVKERLPSRVGSFSLADLREGERALRVQLNLH